MKLQVTYFDTAMVLFEMDGVRFLTDPVLDGAGARFVTGPIVLEKTNPTAVAVEALGRIDAVLLSHDQHGDNLDEAGRALLPKVPRVLTTPEGAERLGGNAEGLARWASVVVSGPDRKEVTVTAMPAQHGPDGTEAATGTVTGFLLESGGKRVYVSGDTVRFAGTKQIAEKYAPVDVAIVHIGRVKLAPMGELEFTLSAAEAVRLMEELGAARIIPIHFDGWKHFSEDRSEAELVFAASGLGGRVTWLRSGDSVGFVL